MVEITVQSLKKSKYCNVANNKCIQTSTVLVLLYNVSKIKGKLSESEFASELLKFQRAFEIQSQYHISSNKSPLRVLNFETVKCGTY